MPSVINNLHNAVCLGRCSILWYVSLLLRLLRDAGGLVVLIRIYWMTTWYNINSRCTVDTRPRFIGFKRLQLDAFVNKPYYTVTSNSHFAILRTWFFSSTRVKHLLSLYFLKKKVQVKLLCKNFVKKPIYE